MNLKEPIVGVNVTPYLDKYMVQVTRQLDRFHLPIVRTYIVDYSDVGKVAHLLSHVIDLFYGIQIRAVTNRVSNYNKERAANE